ncbi:beta-3-deoxy-D-manno-oct-2-ulosonic acid transferase [Vibrio sinaloensis]|uniref:capsular polysaccharide export protein, LipB/KpsS family n=1 Tax=Photobacterium sp. (strain ATCC 43367) TaxID=379097 RepID=UPI00068DFDA8|nr:beta-3-deoxy-D-manno-oct-2-ulosonic acid transferase [Vibrio sinaloensis]
MIIQKYKSHPKNILSKKLFKKFFKRSKPSSERYPYTVHDPIAVFGLNSNLYKFFLVGSNWSVKDKPIAVMWGFNNWKLGFTSDYLKEYRTLFVPRKMPRLVALFYLRKLLISEKNLVHIVWGYTDNAKLDRLKHIFGTSVYRMEDGFVRSAELGASHATPYSLILDKSGIYYNAEKPSDLENILNTTEFSEEIIDSARSSIELISKNKISKYNTPSIYNVGLGKQVKAKKRVVVLGQVDSDASIKYGNPDKWTVDQLIELARKENLDADVIYRPHPEIYKGYQKSKFRRARVEHLARIVSPEEPLIDFLETVDHVYTISSLSGFEALLRGKQVTVVGAPFYSGWGITDDRTKVERRQRTLTLEQVFAGAYLVYSRYLCSNDASLALSLTCNRIVEEKSLLQPQLLSLNYEKTLKSNYSIKSRLWPALFMTNKGQCRNIDGQVVKYALNIDSFSKDDLDDHYQVIQGCVVLSACGSFKEVNATLIILREKMALKAFNNLLLALSDTFGDEHFKQHYFWLLSMNGEHEVASRFSIEDVLPSHTARNNEGEDTEPSDVTPITLKQLKDEYQESNTLEMHLDRLSTLQEIGFISNREATLMNIAKLLLLGFNTHAVVMLSLNYCKSIFAYHSANKMAAFLESYGPSLSNRNFVVTEIEAVRNLGDYSKDKLLGLLMRIAILKPESMKVFFDSFEDYFIENGVDNLDNICRSALKFSNNCTIGGTSALIEFEEFDAAIDSLQLMASFDNDSERVAINLARAYFYKGEIGKAYEVLKPYNPDCDSKLYVHEMINICIGDRRYQEAQAILNKALASGVEVHEMFRRKVHYVNRNLAGAYGCFSEVGLVKLVRSYFYEKYNAEAIMFGDAKKPLLVSMWGPGDEIQMASFYPALIRNSTNPLTIVCAAKLQPLLERSFPSITFIGTERPRLTDQLPPENYTNVPDSRMVEAIDNIAVEAIESCDKFAMVPDAVRLLVKDYDAFERKSFLVPCTNKVNSFAARLAPFRENQLVIGLCWRSSVRSYTRNQHYVTVEDLAPLFAMDNAIFVNLQYDECDEELAWINEHFPGKIVNFEDIDQYDDLDSVAALIANLDLVISAGTAVAELSGALGVPTWLKTCSSEMNWRNINLENGCKDADPLYPESRVIISEKPLDKGNLIGKLETELQTFISNNTFKILEDKVQNA